MGRGCERNWRGRKGAGRLATREGVRAGTAAVSHVQVRAAFVTGSGLVLQEARAEGGPLWPVADHVPVGRSQAVEVVNVELPGDVTAQEFHLLGERVAVSSRWDRRGPTAATPPEASPSLARPLRQACWSAPAAPTPPLAPAQRPGQDCLQNGPTLRPKQWSRSR